MKMFRISFVATCPDCKHAMPINIRGMGESHIEWIEDLKVKGHIHWRCDACRTIMLCVLSGVKTEQEGSR